jgi:hypothetical protein
MPQITKELKHAVLITEYRQCPYSNVKGMMEEITKFGTPTTKRIYADWTRLTQVAGRCFIRTRYYSIQQYSYTSGKNSSDSSLNH